MTTKTPSTSSKFSISNICGGSERHFRLVNGSVSIAAIAHAKRQGSFGYDITGGCAEEVRKQIEAYLNAD